jgi:Tol biopolymer transport system component
VRNADGSGTPSQVTNGQHDANPAMSSDGARIAFSRPAAGTRHLFVMNANGSGLTDLGPGAKPDWSPDNTRLVYGQGGEGPIMVVNVATKVSQVLRNDGEAPVWSPDGTEIAFLHCPDPDSACQIGVMSADGTQVRDLTNEQSAHLAKVDWQAHAH